MKQTAGRSLLATSFSLGFFFDSEDGGNIFLRNVSSLSTDYTALYSGKQNSSTVCLEFKFQNGSFEVISGILVSVSTLANRILFA
jgi:hypothetical protein